jgi:hypothetical protein
MAGTVLAGRTHLAHADEAGTVTTIESARGAVPEPPQTDRCSSAVRWLDRRAVDVHVRHRESGQVSAVCL